VINPSKRAEIEEIEREVSILTRAGFDLHENGEDWCDPFDGARVTSEEALRRAAAQPSYAAALRQRRLEARGAGTGDTGIAPPA
jgi:hypothetical protein